MNFFFVLSTVLTTIFCSLPYTMTVAGLYENMAELPVYNSDNIVTDYKLEGITCSSGNIKLNKMKAFYCEFNTEKKQIYGIFDYEMFKGQFYYGKSRNHQCIEVVYDFNLTTIGLRSSDTCFNVRFLGLTNDKNNTLELKSHSKDYYINAIGGTIKNQYEKIVNEVGKEYILDLQLERRDFPLFYYKSHDECLSDLKSILDKNVDIIGYNNVDSAEKFLKYYSSKIQKEPLSVENHVEAAKMIKDMYNMIGHHRCEFFTTSTPFHAQDPVEENDVVKVYKSVCLGFDCFIFNENVDIKITGFDSNNQVISGDKFMTKQVNRFILIPFEDLIKCGIQSIEVIINGKTTGMIPVSEIIEVNEAPVATEN